MDTVARHQGSGLDFLFYAPDPVASRASDVVERAPPRPHSPVAIT